jgi:hypothetical protein
MAAHKDSDQRLADLPILVERNLLVLVARVCGVIGRPGKKLEVRNVSENRQCLAIQEVGNLPFDALIVGGSKRVDIVDEARIARELQCAYQRRMGVTSNLVEGSALLRASVDIIWKIGLVGVAEAVGVDLSVCPARLNFFRRDNLVLHRCLPRGPVCYLPLT